MPRLNRFFDIILLLLPMVLISGCARNESPAPRAREGLLDLREWDFDTQGSLSLKGQWEFHWHEFTPPGTESPQPEFVDVPSYWNRYDSGNGPVGGMGFATYRLTVLLPENLPPMALKGRDIQTAYSLYADGNKMLASGIVGRSRNQSIPRFSSQIAGLKPTGGKLEILIHVSNFHHRNGGLWVPIELGTEERIRRSNNTAVSIDFFIIGLIVSMGLYHIFRHMIHRSMLKKRNRMSLFFGVFCLLVAVRAAILGELHAYNLFPGLSWAILIRVEYIAFAAALPAFMSYVRALFPDRVPRRIVRVLWYAGAAFALTVCLPARTFTRVLPAYQLITVTSGIYVVIILFLATKRKQPGGRTLLSGFAILFLFVINDILYANHLIHTGHLMDWGLVMLLISQSYLITRLSADDARLLEKQNAVLTETRLGVIVGLAKLAEYRDEETGAHLERIRQYAGVLTAALSTQPRYRHYITREYIDDICRSSILHDIGKVGIPDAILRKPGRLTADEFDIIKFHPKLGGDAISDVEGGLSDRTFLTLGKQIAYCHHEKWDGSGYPQGLAGRDIPLSARIIALVDVYDALTTRRPYKEAMDHQAARDIILDGRGKHFDPDVVEAFLSVEEDFRALGLHLSD